MEFYPFEEDNPKLIRFMVLDIKSKLKKYKGATIKIQVTAKISNHPLIDSCEDCATDKNGTKYGKLFL